jgi:hypothetical protein
MHVVTGDNGQINGLVTENAIPLQPELQFARCMSGRYRTEQFPRCVSCTRRWAGDTCRFQNIRFFLKDKKHDIVGISFVEGRFQNTPRMNFPARWNIPLTETHTKRMKVRGHTTNLIRSKVTTSSSWLSPRPFYLFSRKRMNISRFRNSFGDPAKAKSELLAVSDFLPAAYSLTNSSNLVLQIPV